MKVNLKNLTKDKELLKHLQSVIRDGEIMPLKAFTSKIEKIIRLYEEIEADLEIGGESIIKLDKPRLEALEERNKFIKMLNQADDI